MRQHTPKIFAMVHPISFVQKCGLVVNILWPAHLAKSFPHFSCLLLKDTILYPFHVHKLFFFNIIQQHKKKAELKMEGRIYNILPLTSTLKFGGFTTIYLDQCISISHCMNQNSSPISSNDLQHHIT